VIEIFAGRKRAEEESLRRFLLKRGVTFPKTYHIRRKEKTFKIRIVMESPKKSKEEEDSSVIFSEGKRPEATVRLGDKYDLS